LEDFWKPSILPWSAKRTYVNLCFLSVYGFSTPRSFGWRYSARCVDGAWTRMRRTLSLCARYPFLRLPTVMKPGAVRRWFVHLALGGTGV
jgi:hypothetical protein